MTQSNGAPDFVPAEEEQQGPPPEGGGEAGYDDADTDTGDSGASEESEASSPLSEADRAASDGEGGLTIQGTSVIDATQLSDEPVKTVDAPNETQGAADEQ